jgi:hypothetical protein
MYPVPKEDDPWTMQVAPPVQTMEEAVEMVQDRTWWHNGEGFTSMPAWRDDLENWD